MEYMLSATSKSIRIIVLYRPPPSTSNRLTVSLFFEEFPVFLEKHASSPGDFLLLGDFNFHVEDSDDSSASRFLQLLSTFNLTQHVHQSTHRDNHILDLVITRSQEDIIDNIHVSNPGISDHLAVSFKLAVKKPDFERKVIQFRKLKSIDHNAFQADILSSGLLDMKTENVESSVNQYNQILGKLLDKHAPLKETTVTLRPSAPWYTDEVDEAKRVRRQKERRMRYSQLAVDKQIYADQCKHVADLLLSSKQTYYTNEIMSNAGDQKSLFGVLNKLMHRRQEQPLPSHESLTDLANRFADFFEDKILHIRSNLEDQRKQLTTHELDVCDVVPPSLSEFRPASQDEIRKMIMQAPSKSCPLDPLPTWLVKDCLDALLPVITDIVNLSLCSTMPENLKEALLTPLLKKLSLDPDILKHFRPISNLAFLAKLVEKVVALRVNEHAEEHKLYEKLQSAYKSFHSTETALVKVQNDILSALDNNESVLLVLLDLSAAFDTVDHTILLNRLEKRLGITGQCLDWFRSYLQNRQQKVVLQGKSSCSRPLLYGVPQGSVLGPLLFSAYILPLGDIIRLHGITFHLYADDNQLYLAFKRSDVANSKFKMEDLVAEIRHWLVLNLVKCNDDKTEFLVFCSQFQPKVHIDGLTIGEQSVKSSSHVRNLGVTMDQHLTMEKHIQSIVSSGYHQLRELSRVKLFLTKEALVTAVHAFITSKMDYCNAVLYGLPLNLVTRLQHLQNSAARMISGVRKYDHISPILKDLHWLPVPQRIQYKILLLTYKSLHGLAPPYLSELLQKSRRGDTLIIPLTKRVHFGDRCFSKAAPVLWNLLPSEIRDSPSVEIFKMRLKTFLFTKAYFERVYSFDWGIPGGHPY